MAIAHQRLPASGPEREVLREKGQFWTPDWVADAMVAFVLANGAHHIFDPAVGAGAFFRAAKRIARELERDVELLGTDVDQAPLREALESGLDAADLAGVQIRDFVLSPPDQLFQAIVANPPYIRHHRLPPSTKAALQAFGQSLIGKRLDGRAGYHVYFLLRALQLLERGGRLAFIMPADTCEGIFARDLWRWITSNYRLCSVITFSPEATPFPGVDTNAVIFMIENTAPTDDHYWVRCNIPETSTLKQWSIHMTIEDYEPNLSVIKRSTKEGVITGLSRPPQLRVPEGPRLADYAKVLRGIATGANEFFFMTSRELKERRIPEEFFVRAVGRTRDIQHDEITVTDLETLDALGRPTYLLSLAGRPMTAFPLAVRKYLEEGEKLGLPERPLISSRRPWYKMELRPVPPLLFAYLGRRNARFILNRASVVPLTGFLCVYPKSTDHLFIERLYAVLQHPETISNLQLVGKSYGGGAIKVEPRALEQLPLPAHVVREVGLPFQADLHIPAAVL